MAKKKKKNIVVRLAKAVCLFFRVMYCKLQWLCRKIGLKTIKPEKRLKRSGKYIDDDIAKGFMSNNGTCVHWGKQYHRLFFIGMVD